MDNQEKTTKRTRKPRGRKPRNHSPKNQLKFQWQATANHLFDDDRYIKAYEVGCFEGICTFHELRGVLNRSKNYAASLKQVCFNMPKQYSEELVRTLVCNCPTLFTLDEDGDTFRLADRSNELIGFETKMNEETTVLETETMVHSNAATDDEQRAGEPQEVGMIVEHRIAELEAQRAELLHKEAPAQGTSNEAPAAETPSDVKSEDEESSDSKKKSEGVQAPQAEALHDVHSDAHRAAKEALGKRTESIVDDINEWDRMKQAQFEKLTEGCASSIMNGAFLTEANLTPKQMVALQKGLMNFFDVFNGGLKQLFEVSRDGDKDLKAQVQYVKEQLHNDFSECVPFLNEPQKVTKPKPVVVTSDFVSDEQVKAWLDAIPEDSDIVSSMTTFYGSNRIRKYWGEFREWVKKRIAFYHCTFRDQVELSNYLRRLVNRDSKKISKLRILKELNDMFGKLDAEEAKRLNPDGITGFYFGAPMDENGLIYDTQTKEWVDYGEALDRDLMSQEYPEWISYAKSLEWKGKPLNYKFPEYLMRKLVG